ncbi:g7813 [Coccomyxa viridis]|uniref:G7813 protein n=1 Tax=Coccomyxa viridis TaxID=1274662 RepID=A0ABP1FYT3_9CHLO
MQRASIFFIERAQITSLVNTTRAMQGDSSYSLGIVEQHVGAMGLVYRKHGNSIFLNTGMLLTSPHSKTFELSIQTDPAVAEWAFAETANMTVEQDGSFSIDNDQLCPLYGEYDNVLRHQRPDNLFEHVDAWLDWTRQME